MIGQTFGHYLMVEKIGVGGMGEVYRARDGTIADETAGKLFRKEALALAKLNHPNIATVFEFSTQDGKDFLAMELIPGSSLRERLKQGPLAGGAVFRLGNTIGQRTGCGSRTRRSASRSQIIRTKESSVHANQT